jgi:C-terminal processing protease CtpA/Prc
MVDGLSESQTEQAISALTSGFLDPTKTEEKSIRRATLEGLVLRLAPGATITTEDDANREATPGDFLAEILDSRIGYVRLGGLDKASLTQMDSALENFDGNQLRSVILDLRDTATSGDFDIAADFARRFAPKGKILFSIQKPSVKQERILTSNQSPGFDGILVVLTDADTAGAAEALAATLRLNANAMIVGETTAGEAVEFSNVPLGDGKILRVAIAQIVLPETGPIFPSGVSPDIAAALPPRNQAEIFALSREKGVSQFVFETERPHLNEAALVANTNPEIDASLVGRTQQETWDSVLQRAVDLVTAISFYRTQEP